MSYNPGYGGYPGHQPPAGGYQGQHPQSAGGYAGYHSPHSGYQGQQQQHAPSSGYPGQLPAGYGVPTIDTTVASWFRAVDQDNSGQISAKELKAALQNGNWNNFSDEACRLMIGMFDQDRSGTINIQEFVQLFHYINQWTEVYKRFDQDRSGTIDEHEMLNALNQMGYRLSPTFVSVLVSKFAPRTRRVTLDHFIVANVQVRNLTEAFKARDREMRGVITISYEDFMTLVLTCVA